jgi:hypothetical protein
MNRKIPAMCAALVALGALMIAPAMASAAHTLQDTVGTETVKVELGKKIVAESEETSEFVSPLLTVRCNENIITGSVHKNDGAEIQGTIEDAWFQSNLNPEGTACRSTAGAVVTVTVQLTNELAKTHHWCIRTVPKTDKWQIWGNNCTTDPVKEPGTFTFALHTGGITCYFIRTELIEGTFTTVNAEHKATTLTMSGEPKFVTEAGTSHSSFCPSSGTLKNFKFNVYTDGEATSNAYPPANNGPVFINPVT